MKKELIGKVVHNEAETQGYSWEYGDVENKNNSLTSLLMDIKE